VDGPGRRPESTLVGASMTTMTTSHRSSGGRRRQLALPECRVAWIGIATGNVGSQIVQFVRDDIEIAYHAVGDAESDVIVLLHGLGSARSTWGPLVFSLARRHRVVVVDFRGHGESFHAPGSYTLEYFVPDTIALCESLTTKPVVMVGHSLGGVVAHTIAHVRPDLVRALLLEDPPLYRREGTPDENPVVTFFALLRQVTTEMQARHASLVEYEAVLHVASSPNGAGSFADVLGVEGTRARARGLASLDPDVFLPALDGTGLAGAQPDATLPCPVRLLRADPTLGKGLTDENEARFRSSNPHAEVEMVHGASHFIHDEQPERFLLELHRLFDTL